MDTLLEDLRGNAELSTALSRAWPILDPTDIVADLWEVPAYLRRCTPTLTTSQRAILRRSDPRAWTEADLPLIDAARHRLGDPRTEQARRRRHRAQQAAAREVDAVVEHLIDTDDSEMQVMSMLRGADLRSALEADPTEQQPTDLLAGPFAHIIIDEAQELTDAQWAMILRRCPSRSLTIVGDRAQARHGFTQPWTDRLAQVGLDRVQHATLTLNYRTPAEVMAVAGPVIRAALADANVPTSLRHSGTPVRHGKPADLDTVLQDWLSTHMDGTAAVITTTTEPGVAPTERVHVLTPLTAKGLEFDLVILLDPGDHAGSITASVDRYVAMTRTTNALIVLDQPAPQGHSTSS